MPPEGAQKAATLQKVWPSVAVAVLFLASVTHGSRMPAAHLPERSDALGTTRKIMADWNLERREAFVLPLRQSPVFSAMAVCSMPRRYRPPGMWTLQPSLGFMEQHLPGTKVFRASCTASSAHTGRAPQQLGLSGKLK